MATQQQERRFGSEFVDQVIQWVGENCDIEDVFKTLELEQWAKDNGFVKVADLPQEVQDLLP